MVREYAFNYFDCWKRRIVEGMRKIIMGQEVQMKKGNAMTDTAIMASAPSREYCITRPVAKTRAVTTKTIVETITSI